MPAARFDELTDLASELIVQGRFWLSQAESMKTFAATVQRLPQPPAREPRPAARRRPGAKGPDVRHALIDPRGGPARSASPPGGTGRRPGRPGRIGPDRRGLPMADRGDTLVRSRSSSGTPFNRSGSSRSGACSNAWRACSTMRRGSKGGRSRSS